MIHPLANDVATEQYKDRLREAEAERLVRCALRGRPTLRTKLALRAANLMISIGFSLRLRYQVTR